MENKILSYMEKVRKHYTNDKEEKLTTQEVINRILGSKVKDNNQNINNKVDCEIKFDLGLNDLYNDRSYNNDVWNITAERTIHSHRKFTGRFIVFGKKVVRKFLRWYIDPVTKDQSAFNGSVTRCINEIYNKFIIVENSFKFFASKYESFKKEYNELINDINCKQTELSSVTEELNNKYVQLNNVTEELNNKYKELIGRVENIGSCENSKFSNQANVDILNVVENMENNMNALEENYNYLIFKYNKLQKQMNLSNKNIKIDTNINNNESNKKINEDETNIDYFLFENKFRGNEKKVKESQSMYLKFFTNQQNVLDIGCGRGEFLELLSENNINAVGIDTYNDFVEYCKEKGLNVYNIDALQYLNSIPDNSVGGIFLGQVIEHLDKSYLLKLLQISYKKLRNGAFFVAETPNPTMLSTFTNAFYVDLSHNKPVHPETMKFLLSYYGYKEIGIVFNEASKINYKLPLLECNESVNNIKQFNDGINLLSDMLFGYQDYTVVGRK